MIRTHGCKNKIIPRQNSAQDGGPNAPISQFSDQFCRQRVENEGSYFLRKSAFIISENSPFIFSENRPGLEGDDDDNIFCFLCCFIEGVRQQNNNNHPSGGQRGLEKWDSSIALLVVRDGKKGYPNASVVGKNAPTMA